MIIRKIKNIFIVQQKHTQQIVFSHKNINECYEYIFKTVNFKNGKSATYNHDKVYEVMKDKLEAMACFIKYKSYTATNNIPLVCRNIELV